MGKVHVDESAEVPAGTYKLKFVSFSVRNDADEPVAKSTDSGLRLFGNLEVVGGELEGEMVPFSSDLEAGIVSWCQLLTGMPPVSTKLIDIEKQLQAGHEVEMAVNESGWARGPVVAKAAYLAKFAGFTKRDSETNLPIHVDAEFQKKHYRKVFWQFRIAAGELDGVLVPASCSYAVKQHGEDLELKSKANLYSWCVACGIDWNELPAWKDAENILPELEQVMQQANRLVSIQVGDTGWVDSSQAAVAPAPSGIKLAGDEKAPEEKAPEALFDLYQLMRKIGEKQELGELFDQDGNLTDAGKKFAADKIGPICVEQNIPRHFGKMTEEQIKTLASALEFSELKSAVESEEKPDAF